MCLVSMPHELEVAVHARNTAMTVIHVGVPELISIVAAVMQILA